MPSMNHMGAPEPADTDQQPLEDELAAVSATLAERQETHRQLKSTYLKLLRVYRARSHKAVKGTPPLPL
jgi:hypothetical protein